jgi:4a-hydroxytetrahydrobiopterin dehydratase
VTRPKPLGDQEIAARLAKLQGWRKDGDAIARDFVFADFERAFAFLGAGALEAAKLDHHPDWRNVYSKVWVKLSTHDPKGITELDFALAERLDAHAAALGAK